MIARAMTMPNSRVSAQAPRARRAREAVHDADHDRPDAVQSRRHVVRVRRRGTSRKEVAEPEQDEHQGHAELERQPDARRHRDAEHDERAAHEQHRQRVADAPETADPRGAAETVLARDDGRDRDDVIGVRRVLQPEQEAEHSGGQGAHHHETVLVLRLRKSMRMNWPSVIVLVKYARPRVMLETIFTNSTSARSRASMKVLIMIPERRQSVTSFSVSCKT